MENQPPNIISNRARWILLALTLLEGAFSLYALLSIPADPKNAFLFGFSKDRLLLILVEILVFIAVFAISLKQAAFFEYMTKRFSSSKNPLRLLKWLGVCSALLLWVLVWLPPASLGDFGDSYVRLSPLLFWIGAIVVQTLWTFYLAFAREQIEQNKSTGLLNPKIRLAVIAGFLLLTGAFLLLRGFSIKNFAQELYFPPGAPLSALQVFLIWLPFAFILLFNLELKRPRKLWLVVAFFAIWAATFILWQTSPLTCTDDRIGPYPPNYICYPTINDAVFSIGSHYISLGEGINNLWEHDKPLSLVFLGIGQLLFGQNIDHYLIFQVLVFSVIPALLFLIGTDLLGPFLGWALSLAVALQEWSGIRYYQNVGSVNVRVESSEMLTTLLLVLTFWAFWHWLKQPERHKYAIFTGGLLGLAALARFTPVLVIPFVAALFIVAMRKNIRKAILPLLLFAAAFTLVVLPWGMTNTDHNGENFYLAKIKNTVSSRYNEPTPSDNPPAPTPVKPPETPTVETGDTLARASGSTSVIYHFFNNEFTSLARLPLGFSLQKYQEVLQQPFWDFSTTRPIWLDPLTAENWGALGLNLGLVLLGLAVLSRRYGIAAWAPLTLQAGYFASAALSQTSGGRYIEPVSWVTLIYFAVGAAYATYWLLHKSGLTRLHLQTFEAQPVVKTPLPARKHEIWLWLAVCLLLGVGVIAFNFLPSQLPPETSPEADSLSEQVILTETKLSPEQWQAFLDDPNHLIVQGAAFQANYMRISSINNNGPTFELMVLGRDHVLVSHMSGVQPGPLSDGSRVILVGCQTSTDILWGDDRILMNTFAIIQLDHEHSTYIVPDAPWICTP